MLFNLTELNQVKEWEELKNIEGQNLHLQNLNYKKGSLDKHFKAWVTAKSFVNLSK